MELDNPFSEQESLLLIKSMINKAKNQYSETGHLYLLWGWVILICSLTQFVLLEVFHYPQHYQVWFITWLAAAYQVVYLVRRKKKRIVRTYTDGILRSVWLSFVVSMFLLSFSVGAIRGINFYEVIYPFLLALYGIPTFVSGAILQFRPLMAGGIICWLLAAAAPFLPYQYQLLLLGAAVVAAWIIPGYLLRRRYAQQNL